MTIAIDETSLAAHLEKYLSVRTKIRADATVDHYRRSIRQFAVHLEREPMPADLTDDNLSAFMLATVRAGFKEATANQRTKQLRALWNWMAKRRYKGIEPYGMVFGWLFGPVAFWARLLPMFLAGVLAYHFRDSIRYSAIGATIAMIGLAIASKVPYGLTFAMPTLGAYVMLYLSFTSDVRLRNWAKYGDFSYGVYLYAFPIQQLIMYWIGHPISPWLLFALAISPVLLAGIASWHLVEKWFVARAHTRPVAAFESHSVASTPISASPTA